MPLTLEVHKYARNPGTLEMRLVSTQPYVRLSFLHEPPVFVQGGRIYSAGGDEVDAPLWFDDAIAQLTPVVRAEVGLSAAAAPSPAAPAPARATSRPLKPQRTGEPWQCEECGWRGTTLSKAVHRINHHKKKESVSHDDSTVDDRS